MKKQDIEVGETYLFVGSDSPKRAHLAGKPFTVSSIEKVYRKVPYRHKKRSMKVTRFFNEDGVGAKAEELETLPKTGFYQCKNEDCRKWSRVQDLTAPGCPEYVCLHCGTTAADGVTTEIAECGAQIRLDYEACELVPDPRTEWVEATRPPGKEGFYNVITHNNRLIIAAYQLGEWDCEMMAPGDRVVRYRPNTYQPIDQFDDQVPSLPVPLCVGCNKNANEIQEYIELAQEEETTPDEYVRTGEGSYNHTNGHFLCTDCYIAAGMPTAPDGWVAP